MIVLLGLLLILLGASSGWTQTVSESPNPIAIGSSLTSTWSGVSSPTVKDWVGVFPAGGDDHSYSNWQYTSSCTGTAGSTALASGSCSLLVPGYAVAGSSNLRLFANDGFTKLATSANFTIGASGTLSESPNPVTQGSAVTGAWLNVTPATVRDWVGLFPMGGDDHSYLTWVYTSSCSGTAGGTALASGSCPLSTSGTTAGSTYELRLFSNDGFTRIATSMNFLVGSGSAISFIGRSQNNANSTGANITVTLPAGTVAGDFVVADVCSYNTIPPTPGGWTLLDSFSNSLNDHLLVIYKLVASGETGYTFGPSDYPLAFIDVFRGAQSVDAHGTAVVTGATSLSLPALSNTATANEMYFGAWCSDVNGVSVIGPADLTGTGNATQWGSFDGYKALGAANSAVPAESAHQ